MFEPVIGSLVLLPYANNEGSDDHAHSHSLTHFFVRAFAARKHKVETYIHVIICPRRYINKLLKYKYIQTLPNLISLQ